MEERALREARFEVWSAPLVGQYDWTVGFRDRLYGVIVRPTPFQDYVAVVYERREGDGLNGLGIVRAEWLAETEERANQSAWEEIQWQCGLA